MEPVLLEENEVENIEKSTHAEEIKEIVKVLRTEDDPWEALKSIAFVVEKIIKVPIGGKYYKSLRAHHREGQQMSNRIEDYTDMELVLHYRDMQHLSVDTSTKEGLDYLRYYQRLVREMARRFAILIENKEAAGEKA